MSVIKDFGTPDRPIWVILDQPYEKDTEDGVVLSGGYGYNFKKIWKLAGLDLCDTYIKSLRPCLGASYTKDNVLSHLLTDIDTHHPSIIVPLSDEVVNYLVPKTQQIKEENSSVRKWAGSILTSTFITYPHYVICSQPPDWVTRNWDYNEIQAYIDFGHVREEFEYWKKYGVLNPLPNRNLLIQPSFPDLIFYLHSCLALKYISVDIETIRPKKGSSYYKIHPGYPYTIAVAKSPLDAVSFSFWDYTDEQCIKIWRLLNEILGQIPQIGQNYFLFDAHYLESMGFRLLLAPSRDTLIRHHVLWPFLKHALHFQTRQYTREPYYKDEGKNFNIKRKKEFMTYGAKDAAVTYEIYEAQEIEFNDRPWLR